MDNLIRLEVQNRFMSFGSSIKRRTTRKEKHTPSVIRPVISSPVQITSSTQYALPKVPSVSAVPSLSARSVSNQSSNSSLSGHDSDASTDRPQTPDTPASSIHDSPPCSPVTPTVEPNHLSCYFPTPQRTLTSAGERRSPSTIFEEPPAIPKRALSHTRASHQAMALKRSSSLQSKAGTNKINLAHVRSSQDMFNAGKAGFDSDFGHPFLKELEQVKELAEQFSSELASLEEDNDALRTKQLKKYSVHDYMIEIEELFGQFYRDEIVLTIPGWI